MQIKISPDTPGIFGAMQDTENGKNITGMSTIVRESLYTDAGEKVTPESADVFLRAMSYRVTNDIAEKFKRAMEALKAEALPPTGSGT